MVAYGGHFLCFLVKMKKCTQPEAFCLAVSVKWNIGRIHDLYRIFFCFHVIGNEGKNQISYAFFFFPVVHEVCEAGCLDF